MSDQGKQKICAQGGKNVSSQQSRTSRPQFAHIDADNQKLFDPIKKLNDPIGYLSDTTELNNNSILSPNAEVSGYLTKMADSKRKSPQNENGKQQPSSPGTATNITPIDASSNNDKQQPSVLQIPTYTSIFATNRSTSPNSNNYQQRNQGNGSETRRGSLKKQSAADLELSAASIDQLSGRKFQPLNYSNNKDHHNHNPSSSLEDEDDENDGDEIDERLPFNTNSMKKLRSSHNYKRVPIDHRSCPYASKHPMAALEHHKENPHTRISFNDSRPPSFNTCQHAYDHEALATQRLDWLADQAIHAKYEVDQKAYKKAHKSLASHPPAEYYDAFDRKYTRTKSINLMLKTIVLTLLTLLLLMLFVGIILASHYLPQAIDRVLSASRSFNVTIAG